MSKAQGHEHQSVTFYAHCQFSWPRYTQVQRNRDKFNYKWNKKIIKLQVEKQFLRNAYTESSFKTPQSQDFNMNQLDIAIDLVTDKPKANSCDHQGQGYIGTSLSKVLSLVT